MWTARNITKKGKDNKWQIERNDNYRHQVGKQQGKEQKRQQRYRWNSTKMLESINNNNMERKNMMFIELSSTAIKGLKSQYLFVFASTFALKAVSSTDKNPRRQSTRLMTRQNFHFLLSLLKAKRFCWEPRSSSLPQAPPSWYKTTLNLPAGLH